MKTNKEDIRVLKSKHRLELVMQAAGEVFEVAAGNSDLWRSTSTPGLTVDIRRQLYEIKKPGMDAETGDVLTWLQVRYSWSFAMALKFLQNRAPDPMQAQPIPIVKTKNKVMPLSNEYIVRTVIYTDPITGRQDCGIDYRYDLMDDLQKRAIQILENAHLKPDWIIDYFSKSSVDVWFEMQKRPHRFTRIEDVGINKCGRCGTPFNWDLRDTYACAVQKEINIELDFDEVKKLNDAFGEIVVNAKEYMLGGFYLDSFWIIGDDDDDILCPDCAFKARKRYEALRLCLRSARRREESAAEEQRQLERERAEEEYHEREAEQERIEYEAYLKSESP